MLAKEAGKTYDNYGTIAHDLLGKGATPEEAEREQRDRMERQMANIAKALQHISGVSDDDAASDTGMKVGAVIKGEHGVRIAAAVVDVAKKVEDNVALLAATATPVDGDQPVQGALTIKQVRRATGKLLAAKTVATPPNPLL